MTQAVSFSIYGSNPRYVEGLIRNLSIAPSFYPGWQVHVWIDPLTTPPDLPWRVSKAGGIVHYNPPWCLNGMFARFLIHDEPGVDRFLIRDVDSRFCEREVKAVKHWLESNTLLHVLRDHPLHGVEILGAAWGMRLKEKRLVSMSQAIQGWCSIVKYGQDQDFLTKVVWPLYQDSMTLRDSCSTFKGPQPPLTPWPYDGPAFVGEYIDEYERPNTEHRRMRMERLGVKP
jgi:hypothetical protein